MTSQPKKKLMSRAFTVAAAVAATAGITVSWCDSVRSEGSLGPSSEQTRTSNGRDSVVELFAELETGAQFPKSINPPALTDDKGLLHSQKPLHYSSVLP